MTKIPATILPHGKDLPLPTYATSGSLGLDLRAAIDEPKLLYPYSTQLIPTGLAIDLSDTELGLLILPRSGLSSTLGITLANSVGLVDQDYTDEIQLAVYNQSTDAYIIHPATRLAQAVFIPIVQVQLNLQEHLIALIRSNSSSHSGFGSTGVA